jgi:hypothetical protein
MIFGKDRFALGSFGHLKRSSWISKFRKNCANEGHGGHSVSTKKFATTPIILDYRRGIVVCVIFPMHGSCSFLPPMHVSILSPAPSRAFFIASSCAFQSAFARTLRCHGHSGYQCDSIASKQFNSELPLGSHANRTILPQRDQVS